MTNQKTEVSTALLQEIAEKFRHDFNTLKAIIWAARKTNDIDEVQDLLRAAERYTEDLFMIYERVNDLAEAGAEVQS